MADRVLRVFAVSDIHTDHEENWQIIQNLETSQYEEDDVLIVAGDISSDLTIVRETLETLKSKFSTVFYVPGNNEHRLSKRDSVSHSIEKIERIMECCQSIGVETTPRLVRDTAWIVPLQAWYSPRFDPLWDGQLHYQRGWLDFRKCRWPEELSSDPSLHSVNEYYLRRNANMLEPFCEQITSSGLPVITFSHFLPRVELLPWRIFLKHKSLPLVVGSPGLDDQIRQLGTTVHVYGHTHINRSSTIKNVRYIQNAMAHPNERRGIAARLMGRAGPYRPKCVWKGPVGDHTRS